MTGAETLYDEGFTLIELMVVILIIAVLVAIAVPVYLSLETKADKAVAAYNIKAAEEIHNEGLGRGTPEIQPRLSGGKVAFGSRLRTMVSVLLWRVVMCCGSD